MRGKGKEIMLDLAAGVTLLGQRNEQKKCGFSWWLYALTPQVLSDPSHMVCRPAWYSKPSESI